MTGGYLACPNLSSLRLMSRSQLQLVSKTNRLKATLKTELLFDNLVDMFGGTEQENRDAKLKWREEQANVGSTRPSKVTAAPVPKPKPKPQLKPKQKAVVVPSKKAVVAVEDEEDEMRMGTPAKSKGKAAVRVKAAAPSKAKKVVEKGVEREVDSVASGSRERIVYATSPGTKSTIAMLLETVATLRNDLADATNEIKDLKSTVNSLPPLPTPVPSSPKLSTSDVHEMVVALTKQVHLQARQPVSDDPELAGLTYRVGVLESTGESLSLAQEYRDVDFDDLQARSDEMRVALADLETKFASCSYAFALANRDDRTRVASAECVRSPSAPLVQSPAPDIPSPVLSDAPPANNLPDHYSPTPASPLLDRHFSLRKRPLGTDFDLTASPLFRPTTGRDEGTPGEGRKRARQEMESEEGGETALMGGGRDDDGKRRFLATSIEELDAPLSSSSSVSSNRDVEEEETQEGEEESLSFGETSFHTDSIMPTKMHSPPPSAYGHAIPAGSSNVRLPSSLARRASLPRITLPFPLASPSKSRPLTTASPFADASNAVVPTPQAARTMYGSEMTPRTEGGDGRFGDVMMGSGTRWVKKSENAVAGRQGGVWGGFGAR